VQSDSRVIAYDDAQGAEGAARAWWMLAASGVSAALLNGGWGAAVKARVSIDEEIPEPTKSDFTFAQWLLPTVDIEAVDKLRLDPEWLLLDARTPERWAGISEPFDPIAGRIPGSKNIFYRENLNGEFFKKPQELREMYLALLGNVPPHKVIASCGSGMIGCHILLAMHIAGLEGSALYVGSFSEWCRNREDVGTGKNDKNAPSNM
jgi:thiosulfate/3-mercaptopyruvate sulfurtransferase